MVRLLWVFVDFSLEIPCKRKFLVKNNSTPTAMDVLTVTDARQGRPRRRRKGQGLQRCVSDEGWPLRQVQVGVAHGLDEHFAASADDQFIARQQDVIAVVAGLGDP